MNSEITWCYSSTVWIRSRLRESQLQIYVENLYDLVGISEAIKCKLLSGVVVATDDRENI